MPWAVAYLAPNTELAFRDWVREWRWGCYVPTVKRTVKVRQKRKPIEVERVVFACYAFVEEPILWEVLHGHNAPGFRRIIQHDGAVLVLSDPEIDRLWQMQVSGAFEKSGPQELIFNVGDKCRVIDGLFKDEVATVDRQLKRLNGLVEVTIRNSRVKISALLLEKNQA